MSLSKTTLTLSSHHFSWDFFVKTLSSFKTLSSSKAPSLSLRLLSQTTLLKTLTRSRSLSLPLQNPKVQFQYKIWYLNSKIIKRNQQVEISEILEVESWTLSFVVRIFEIEDGIGRTQIQIFWRVYQLPQNSCYPMTPSPNH